MKLGEWVATDARDFEESAFGPEAVPAPRRAELGAAVKAERAAQHIVNRLSAVTGESARADRPRMASLQSNFIVNKPAVAGARQSFTPRERWQACLLLQQAKSAAERKVVFRQLKEKGYVEDVVRKWMRQFVAAHDSAGQVGQEAPTAELLFGKKRGRPPSREPPPEKAAKVTPTLSASAIRLLDSVPARAGTGPRCESTGVVRLAACRVISSASSSRVETPPRVHRARGTRVPQLDRVPVDENLQAGAERARP